MSNHHWISKNEGSILPIKSFISSLDRKEFENDVLNRPSFEYLARNKRAFDALLAYEKNCILKYDYPDNRPSRPPKEGERREDFARMFDVEIKEMMAYWREVETALKNSL